MEKIIVMYEKLGNAKGYYSKIYDILFIHINDNLSQLESEQLRKRCEEHHTATKKHIYVFH